MEYNYKGNYYQSDLCRFVGLDPSKQHYKSYILECMKQKLEYKYGRYTLNERYIELMNNHNISMSWSHSVSKSNLSRMITSLKINKPNTSFYLILNINEKGLDTDHLVI